MAATAKQIRAAAASVRGARAAGIETQAAKEAPEILRRAEEALARMEARVNAGDPLAQDAAWERVARAATQLPAYRAAVEELRGALACD